MAKFGPLVHGVFHASNGARAIVAVMEYIQSVTQQSVKEVRMAMQETDLIDWETYKNIRWPGWREDEAFEKGLEKGLEKGRRVALIELLEVRFGKVPAWATKRVMAAPMDELGVMTRQVVLAQTIADVVGTNAREAKPKPAKARARK